MFHCDKQVTFYEEGGVQGNFLGQPSEGEFGQRSSGRRGETQSDVKGSILGVGSAC